MSSAEITPRPRRIQARLPRPAHVSLPPLRRREFWTVQALVFAIAAGHTLLETVLRVEFPEPLYLIPTSLFFIPVVYAALAFGLRGSVATALWSIVLTLPNVLVLHDGLTRVGIIWQQAILLAVAIFVGLRVDQERLARAQAEAREREREASEERYRALFDGAAEAVFVIADDGTIEEANEAAAQLLGGDLATIVGQRATDLLGREIGASLLADDPSGAPLGLPREGKEPTRWVEVQASRPVIDHHGRRSVRRCSTTSRSGTSVSWAWRPTRDVSWPRARRSANGSDASSTMGRCSRSCSSRGCSMRASRRDAMPQPGPLLSRRERSWSGRPTSCGA